MILKRLLGVGLLEAFILEQALLPPGHYQPLKAYAIATDGVETQLALCAPATTTTRHFTVSSNPSTISLQYDNEGSLTQQTITNTANKTTKELTWDAFGRLVKVTERDSENNGYNRSAVYDGFGRRLKTIHTPVTAGILETTKTETYSSFFDPMVEFLEIGVKVNDQLTTWKAYGPHKNGTHGGLNGIGGLEEIITPTKTYSIINNALGHHRCHAQWQRRCYPSP